MRFVRHRSKTSENLTEKGMQDSVVYGNPFKNMLNLQTGNWSITKLTPRSICPRGITIQQNIVAE